jgi:peptide deformylase
MAVRRVLLYPHPLLKRRARELGQEDRERELIARLGADLLETMRAYPGCVGIAAPQLGELVRMVVIDVRGHRKTTACHGELVLVNPVVRSSEGSEIAREGCLSIPKLTANVRRASAISLEALTPEGGRVEIETEGFEARCILHEIDHLDGILFLDRVDSLARDVFRRRTSRPEGAPR